MTNFKRHSSATVRKIPRCRLLHWLINTILCYNCTHTLCHSAARLTWDSIRRKHFSADCTMYITWTDCVIRHQHTDVTPVNFALALYSTTLVFHQISRQATTVLIQSNAKIITSHSKQKQAIQTWFVIRCFMSDLHDINEVCELSKL